MKAKLKIVILAVVLFLIGFAVMQMFAPDKFLAKVLNKSGTLRIESTPTTNVFLDNNLLGQTPLQISLKEGVYTIKLVPESAEISVISFTTKIRVFKDITTYVNRELTASDLTSSGEILTLEKSSRGGNYGQILVNSQPSGVFVSLDGEDRGVAPLFMDNVNPGEHELGLRGEGLVPRSIKVNVVAGYKLLADFKLAIDEEYKAKKAAEKKSKEEKQESETFLEILDTPTGWLRVRVSPSLEASEAAKVNPGETYRYFSQEEGWYEIEYKEGERGWVSGDYIRKLEEKPQE